MPKGQLFPDAQNRSAAIIMIILLTNCPQCTIIERTRAHPRETTVFGGSIMNKAELIEAITNETGMSKKDVDAVLKSFVTVVSETLQKKDKVQLIGFGTFETSERAARTGRNPANGESIKIAASTLVKFKAGAALKEKVNTKPAKKSKKK